MPETPEDLVELRTVVNELEAGLIKGVLAEAGIPASHRTAQGIYLAFGMSSLNPSTVLVRRGDVERAEEALAANRSDSVDIDWDEVDVGELDERTAAVMAPATVQISRARKRVVRGVGLMVLMVVLIGPAIGAMAGTVAWYTPWKSHAGAVGVAAGLTAALCFGWSIVQSRRGARHDADVFGGRE